MRCTSRAGILVSLFLAACSADSEAGGASWESSGASGGQAGQMPGGTAGDEIDIPPLVIKDGLPEELEEAPVFGAPVVTGDYLWSTNPTSGKVALIEASTLATRVVSAGLLPTHLAGLASTNYDASAIVINLGTSDASLFRLSGRDIESHRIPLHVGANQWAVSESGRFAVAWSRTLGEVDPADGLQEITLIRLGEEDPEAQRIIVGYRPSQVVFNASEDQLTVVSQLGVSLVNLLDASVAWVALDQGDGRDISITQDGRHALVRQPGESRIQLVSLTEQAPAVELEFSGIVTDLDLSPSGRAVAVIRENSEVATFLVQDVLDGSQAIDSVELSGEIFGSVELTADGRTAVLYTNAAESSWVSVVDLAEGDSFLSARSLNTQTPVQSVSVSPDGRHAVALGKSAEGVSAGAFSLLSLKEERFPRVIGTQAPLAQVHLGDRFGVVTANSESTHEAHLLSVEGLHVDTVELASPPTSAGILPDLDLGFAAQNHPEGRVTFFKLGEAEAQTLTGFELSSEIVEE